MSVLSAQSIRGLCIDDKNFRYHAERDIAMADNFRDALASCERPLISPFSERAVVNGKSYGLSACTYDCRIDQDLVLEPGATALVSTIERFCFPYNVCGHVLDKSSYARKFVSVFNTHFDPGFEGWATIELANHGDEAVRYERGDPVCQFKFEWLDEPTDSPYIGRKYSGQPARPVPALSEEC